MRVVIDTNIILTAFGRNSESQWIVRFIAEGVFSLIVSNDIMLEYEEVLFRQQNHFLAKAAVSFLHAAYNVIPVDVYYHWNLIHTDPDDNKFVDCAIAGNADAIITEDAHFDALQKIPFPKVNVLSTKEFAVLLGIELS
jgi:putative PIN family toxin of toxin-antitoxin system